MTRKSKGPFPLLSRLLSFVAGMGCMAVFQKAQVPFQTAREMEVLDEVYLTAPHQERQMTIKKPQAPISRSREVKKPQSAFGRSTATAEALLKERKRLAEMEERRTAKLDSSIPKASVTSQRTTHKIDPNSPINRATWDTQRQKPVVPPPKADFCRTSSTGYEILLDSILGGFFREDGFFPEGSVLDVGAQFGEMACHFAVLAPERTVHALDPSTSQCVQISKFAIKLHNLKVTHAGIGGKLGVGTAGPGFTGMAEGEEFRIETLDNLFYNKKESLAFAHIDVEGLELEVLKGGNKTIAANKPIFTTELRVQQDPDYSRALLDYINELGYDTYVVDEPCGWPHMDYRNLISFPRSMSDRLEYSDTFNLALATEAIFRVNRKTIFEKVYPCCALGEACCQVNSTDDPKCCHEGILRKWHRRGAVRKPIVMQGFTYSKQRLYGWWGEIRGRTGLTSAEAYAT